MSILYVFPWVFHRRIPSLDYYESTIVVDDGIYKPTIHHAITSVFSCINATVSDSYSKSMYV